ncbi:peptidyl-alpha-hydroxyglycine alpha-amidating lyase family protein [Desertimonas flava]|uniref:peptidyl-alpha-hydroxyglycine alpha-amidating lyase family protein n=1 Tax=Desertimonas flava TaxID=2064846 RepID=UPI000E3440E2|nr:peptidyl-alpha-hydroxyglycine alpha-amidating lyase family protein [Desertimonas flava]
MSDPAAPSPRPLDEEFELDAGWPAPHPQCPHRDVSGVDVDSAGNIYLLTRHDHRVLVFEPDGTLLRAWGEGVFTAPHGLTVGPDDTVYCVDNGDHTVRRFTPDGRLLMTLGSPHEPSDTGFDPTTVPAIHSVETVVRPAGPFNGCTNVAVTGDGHLFVADGYGNCRIHHFDDEGSLLHSWGDAGTGPGEFHLPHCIALTHDGRVLVGDRENDRIQVFAPDGAFLAEWTDLRRPAGVAVGDDGRIYVAELWRPAGEASFTSGVATVDQPGRVTVLDPDGAVLTRWGASSERRGAPGTFIAPHDIAVDAGGRVYVAEVTYTFAVGPGLVGPSCAQHQLQRFGPRSGPSPSTHHVATRPR